MKPYRFKQEALEIREPSLPQPWIHYLSNGELHAFASQAGVGEIRADGTLLESPFLPWDWLRGRERVEVEVTLGGNQ